MHNCKSPSPLAIQLVLCNRKCVCVVSAICEEWQRGTHVDDKAMQPTTSATNCFQPQHTHHWSCTLHHTPQSTHTMVNMVWWWWRDWMTTQWWSTHHGFMATTHFPNTSPLKWKWSNLPFFAPTECMNKTNAIELRFGVSDVTVQGNHSVFSIHSWSSSSLYDLAH